MELNASIDFRRSSRIDRKCFLRMTRGGREFGSSCDTCHARHPCYHRHATFLLTNLGLCFTVSHSPPHSRSSRMKWSRRCEPSQIRTVPAHVSFPAHPFPRISVFPRICSFVPKNRRAQEPEDRFLQSPVSQEEDLVCGIFSVNFGTFHLPSCALFCVAGFRSGFRPGRVSPSSDEVQRRCPTRY